MSPGFHGRSLVTRQLGKLTHQILPVARAAPVVSMAPNLARGDIFTTVFTPTVTLRHRRPPETCPRSSPRSLLQLMATFHKMKDESGTEAVRCFDQGHAGHVSTLVSRISAPAGGVGATRRRIAAAGLHPGNSQRVDVGHFGAHGHVPLGRAPAGAVLGDAARVVARFGRMAQRPTTARRNGKI
jgi:hypothetical protein